MAIFTSKADRGVPLLTQFYQLEIPLPTPFPGVYGRDLMETELLPWAAGIAQTTQGQVFRKGPDGEDVDASGEVSWPQIIDMNRLGKIHPVMKRMMNAAADRKNPLPDDLVAFNAWQEACHTPAPRLHWIDTTVNPDEPRFIVFQNAQPVRLAMKYIDRVLIEQFSRALIAQENHILPRGWAFRGFSRCEECRSPFLVAKEGQRFCSARCRQRQGQRLRMRRLFEV